MQTNMETRTAPLDTTVLVKGNYGGLWGTWPKLLFKYKEPVKYEAMCLKHMSSHDGVSGLGASCFACLVLQHLYDTYHGHFMVEARRMPNIRS